MSGYLFFRDINGQWDWDRYRAKLKRRLFTLIIPFLVWNLLAYLADLVWFGAKGLLINDYSTVVKYINDFSLSVFWNIKPIGLHTVNWLGWPTPTAGPMDLPLWYLRDLIVLVLFSPLIWFCLNKTRGWALTLLFIAYISRIWFITLGFGITGLFFFSIGAFLGMRQIDITKMAANKFGWVMIPTIVLAVMAVYYRGTYTVIGQNIMPFYVITAVVSALHIAGRLVRRGCQPNSFLVKSCFFVFACHDVEVKSVANTIIEKLFDSAAVWPLQFGLIVILVLLFCLGIFFFINRWVPSLAKYLTGNK